MTSAQNNRAPHVLNQIKMLKNSKIERCRLRIQIQLLNWLLESPTNRWNAISWNYYRRPSSHTAEQNHEKQNTWNKSIDIRLKVMCQKQKKKWKKKHKREKEREREYLRNENGKICKLQLLPYGRWTPNTPLTIQTVNVSEQKSTTRNNDDKLLLMLWLDATNVNYCWLFPSVKRHKRRKENKNGLAHTHITN